MKNATILLVDDNRDILIILEGMLRANNYHVATAVDGRSGLQMVEEYRPDLILLDMNMPVMDGLEMLTVLRQTDSIIPVILMTAYGSEQMLTEALRLGVRDYLVKPVTHADLIRAVDSALLASRRDREREELHSTLLTAEAVRTTVVTLSHYLNNYLTALNGGLQLLEEKINQDWPDAELLQLLTYSRTSSTNIEAVLRVLVRATDVRLAAYSDTTPMLDIQSELQKELDQLSRPRRK